MRRALAAAVVLIAAAWTGSAAAAPLVVRATFDASIVQFGDPIRTHVVVLLDPTQMRAGSVRIVDDAGPLTPLSAPNTTRTTRSGTLVIAIAHTFSCISSSCVTAKGDATPALPHVTVTALTKDGRTVQATASWPVLQIRGRVSAADLARSQPPFRANTTPQPPTYRIAPSSLAWLLDGLALVLALAAAALAANVALRLARRGAGAPAAGEFERALRLARDAESRPPVDRRRALGLLARLLDKRNRRLAGTASDLAWARPDPERDSLATFVSDVEREVPS
jgi:hypothetical protein